MRRSRLFSASSDIASPVLCCRVLDGGDSATSARRPLGVALALLEFRVDLSQGSEVDMADRPARRVLAEVADTHLLERRRLGACQSPKRVLVVEPQREQLRVAQ